MDALQLLKEEAKRKRKALQETAALKVSRGSQSLPVYVLERWVCLCTVWFTLVGAHQQFTVHQGKKYLKRAELQLAEAQGGQEGDGGGREQGERGQGGEESGAGGVDTVVSPTSATPGDDNPLFAIPRAEVGEWR